MKVHHRMACEILADLRLFLLISGAFCCLPWNLLATEIPLNSWGYQFYSKSLEIEWKLSANQLPTTARTFKVVPFVFSHAIISNLVKWGGFEGTNRVWISDDGTRIDRNTFVYQKNGNRQWLVINPAIGLAHLYNPTSSREMPEGVPDESRAYLLATNILRQLGICTNELISDNGKLRAWFYPGEMTSRGITRRSHMGVEFRRQLDGAPCTLERISIDFESHEKITRLEMNWRGLKPSKRYLVANSVQMAAWVREGRARVQSIEGPLGARWIHTADIKRITIIGATTHYSNATRYSDVTEAEVGRLYPYTVLQADAEISPDDHETIWLSCPMIATDLNQPSRAETNNIGFSIYPSQLRDKQRGEAETH